MTKMYLSIEARINIQVSVRVGRLKLNVIFLYLDKLTKFVVVGFKFKVVYCKKHFEFGIRMFQTSGYCRLDNALSWALFSAVAVARDVNII